MNKVILHIGYPKTGTTWFQNTFYPNVEDYEYFNRKEFGKKLLLPENDFLKYALEKTKNNNLIICEENILGINNKNKIEKLHKAFPNSNVVIFLRNQINIIESTYFLYIHSGGTMSIKELILLHFINGNIKRWNYYSYLKPYIDTFGKDKINVFLYEDFKTNTHEFIERFKLRFDLKINNKISFKKVNKSYSSFLIKTARFTNKFSKTQTSFYRPEEICYTHIPYLHEATHTIYSKINFGKSLKLEKNINKLLFRKLVDYFKDENAQISKEFNLNLEEYNYPL